MKRSIYQSNFQSAKYNLTVYVVSWELFPRILSFGNPSHKVLHLYPLFEKFFESTPALGGSKPGKLLLSSIPNNLPIGGKNNPTDR